MREIKFRAWRICEQRFIDDGFAISQDGLFLYLDDLQEYGIPEDFIVMQFTGLKDKNGNEIYEGDICSVDGGENIYEIIFYMGGFMVAVLSRKIRIYHIGDSLFNNVEVIGNIHENPELLK